MSSATPNTKMNELEINFFKYFLTCQICDKETAVSVFSKLKQDANLENSPTFVGCVDAVNNFIKIYDLEVVEGKSEISGEDFCALVQVCENNVTQLVKMVYFLPICNRVFF